MAAAARCRKRTQAGCCLLALLLCQGGNGWQTRNLGALCMFILQVLRQPMQQALEDLGALQANAAGCSKGTRTSKEGEQVSAPASFHLPQRSVEKLSLSCQQAAACCNRTLPCSHGVIHTLPQSLPALPTCANAQKELPAVLLLSPPAAHSSLPR